MVKFLASDLDGTLYRNNKISEEDMSALELLKSNGHKMIVSTGRSFKELKPILIEYPFDYDYLVLCNGGTILDNNDEIICRRCISDEVRKKIINDFYNIGDALIYFDDGSGVKIIENNAVGVSGVHQDFLNNFAEKISFEAAMNIKCDCEIMSIFSTNESIKKSDRIKEEVLYNYSNEVEAFRNQVFVDIVPKGCSKGNGLLKVLQDENTTPDKLYCVGDSLNDISMFNITNNSYTFNNVEDVVKQYANNYVDYVHEVINDILK